MAKAGRKKGTKDSAPRKVKAAVADKDRKEMETLLAKCTKAGLKFALKVIESKEQIEISQYTKEGEVKKYKVDKYSPDLKIKTFQVVLDKVFADKKELGVGPTDPDKPVVVGFNFTPIEKAKK